MKVFVTVGSTRFPELVQTVLSPDTIEILLALGYTSLRIQYGTDKRIYLDRNEALKTNMVISGFDYSPSIEKEMEQADMIISHAGSLFSF
jgi:beta-1,4-N-acetylglucosaminyltransferase